MEVVIFTPCPVYPQEKSLQYLLDGKLGGPLVSRGSKVNYEKSAVL
jgi:hypothetical protein